MQAYGHRVAASALPQAGNMTRTPLFASRQPISVVLPSCADGLRGRIREISMLLQSHATQLQAELGAPLQWMTFDPGRGPRWLLGPASCNPSIRIPSGVPTHTVDRKREILITDAPTLDEMLRAISAVGSLAYLPDGVHTLAPPTSLDEVVSKIQLEIGDFWPAFSLKSLDWRAICERSVPTVRTAKDPVAAVQAWLALLGDPATGLRPTTPTGTLPYRLWLQQDAGIFLQVPSTSVAWRAGVRPGWRLLGVDTKSWWNRINSLSTARPLVAGRMMMTGPAGADASWSARSPSGALARWSEAFPTASEATAVSFGRTATGSGLLTVRTWSSDPAFEEAIDQALDAARGAHGLIVDLRGNAGEHRASAIRFRARFLREHTQLGALRFRVPGAGLTEAEGVFQDPAPRAARWEGPVRFLTDALTQNASEEALFGLQGLPWVELVGEPTGGGSRRDRHLPLFQGWNLAINTALTYDRQRRCLEVGGIPVDRVFRPPTHQRPGEDGLMLIADRRWT